ncbi:hypothetical protein [Bifidobacterium olomucense]|uniref:Uncharacterized protein n=1 Tax=Bifidobacterium olomucense TaxID=2675324 RepID=A0A7Y0EXX2_9BIFI|nr:hypothetical protein [Bifidobacterium sp. DSM 109959]NMM98113.1 hypothetical protein [Bifidobacterium sp. DSM 109959]
MSVIGLFWFVLGALFIIVGSRVTYMWLRKNMMPNDSLEDRLMGMFIAIACPTVGLLIAFAIYQIFMMMVFPSSMQ